MRRAGIVRLAGAAAAALWRGACASGPAPPAWLDGSSTTYPSDRFVVGVGANADAGRSEEMALRSIAEQTRGETEGAWVAETYREEKRDTWWTLAVLDRAPLLARFSSELAAIDARATAALDASGSREPARALPLLVAAVGELPERNRLRQRVVNLKGTPSPDDATAARQAEALRKALADVKGALHIEVASFEMDAKTGETGAPLDENRRALVQRVIALGFKPEAADTAWGHDAVWLRVGSKVAIERLFLHPDDEMVAVHWDAALEVTDVAGGGDVVALLTDEGPAVHLNETEARRQADADARSFAATALESFLASRATVPADAA